MRNLAQEIMRDEEEAAGLPCRRLDNVVELETRAVQEIAVPVYAGSRLLGLLFVDGRTAAPNRATPQLQREMTRYIQAAIDVMRTAANSEPLPPRDTLMVRRFAADSSIFINEDYLIKGVAGAVLWKLLREYQTKGRSEFCYRELRLDPALKLPDIVDNLGARLILLERRLAQQCPTIRIERTGRGRFRLRVDAHVILGEC